MTTWTLRFSRVNCDSKMHNWILRAVNLSCKHLRFGNWNRLWHSTWFSTVFGMLSRPLPRGTAPPCTEASGPAHIQTCMSLAREYSQTWMQRHAITCRFIPCHFFIPRHFFVPVYQRFCPATGWEAPSNFCKAWRQRSVHGWTCKVDSFSCHQTPFVSSSAWLIFLAGSELPWKKTFPNKTAHSVP